MTDKPRSERLGLEPGIVPLEADEPYNKAPLQREIAHSIAISLMGLRIATERIADAVCGDSGRYGLNDIGETLVRIEHLAERKP